MDARVSHCFHPPREGPFEETSTLWMPLSFSPSRTLSVSNGSSSETTNSPLRSSPLHQFPTHPRLTRSRRSLVFRARFAPFQSLVSIRSYMLLLTVSLSPPSLFSFPLSFSLASPDPCFRIHFVPRQPRDRASNLHGLIKRPFVTLAHTRVHLTRAHQCTHSRTCTHRHTCPRVHMVACACTHAHRCAYSRAGFVSPIGWPRANTRETLVHLC